MRRCRSSSRCARRSIVRDEILSEQIEYYRARAPEFDEWYRREGIYSFGDEWNERWLSEADEVAAAIERFGPEGRILELACGTGYWTSLLAPNATAIVGVDASPEVLEIARERAPA